jgi:hypothetical protein
MGAYRRSNYAKFYAAHTTLCFAHMMVLET